VADYGATLERDAPDWQVSWSRNAAVVLKATRGRLIITDGVIHKELELDPTEVRTGHMVYTPMTDDVFLRLEIVGPDSATPITESVRLVAANLHPLLSQSEGIDARPGDRTGAKRISASEGGAPGIGRSKSAAAQPPSPIYRQQSRASRPIPTSLKLRAVRNRSKLQRNLQ
jgi:hypothetical protein